MQVYIVYRYTIQTMMRVTCKTHAQVHTICIPIAVRTPHGVITPFREG